MMENWTEKEDKRQLIYGRHPIEELLRSDQDIDKIFMHKTLKGPIEKLVRAAAKERQIPISKVDNIVLDKLSNRKNHQGILAFTSPVTFSNIEDIIPFVFEKKEIPLILILDHVTDVRNFGSILRSAEIFGVHAVIIPRKGSASLNDDAVKSSAGAIFSVPICRVSNLEDTVSYLKSSGISIVSAVFSEGNEIYKTDFVVPTAIVVGAEDRGVTRELTKLSDSIISIPQIGNIDSLNVSVATGIILYDVIRQRNIHK